MAGDVAGNVAGPQDAIDVMQLNSVNHDKNEEQDGAMQGMPGQGIA